ncbi:MAG: arginine--tRNA ligase [Candidatus Omnitrophica bacterium]|nr:arginine--tRNA ligase [Candidatus Omnitrophota bacterium]
MKPNTESDLLKLIRDFFKEKAPALKLPQELGLDAPRLRKFGDLTSHIAFKLSKELKQNPNELAKELAAYLKARIDKGPLKTRIESVNVAGAGFINFLFTKHYFYEGLSEVLRQGATYGRQNIGRDKPVLIEFVSANPTGPLSIAHARQAAVGDTLNRILSFLGFKAKKEYYLNDEGHQIDVLANSIYLRVKELKGEKIEFPEDGYQGEYIYDIAKEILKEKPDAEKEKIEFFLNYGVKSILEGITRDLKDFGVEFDFWTSQKGIRKSGKIKKALEDLKRRGFIYESEGAVWFKSTSFGDDKDRVVIKSDGTYTYLAPDIAYHREKYRRGFKWLINLWGPDHHGYINRLRASASALGHEKESISIIIVQLATIFRDGKPVVMSTRRGQLITLREILDEVGKDAARFFFLMRKTDSHLDFDLTLAKQQTPQNPVFYVQYAYARINSILKKSETELGLSGDIAKLIRRADLSLLKSEEELALSRTLLQFPLTLKFCYETIDPQGLSVYLQDLATDFHKFYDLHRVLGEDKALSLARLSLCMAVKVVLTNGLSIMGISAPSQM